MASAARDRAPRPLSGRTHPNPQALLPQKPSGVPSTAWSLPRAAASPGRADLQWPHVPLTPPPPFLRHKPLQGFHGDSPGVGADSGEGIPARKSAGFQPFLPSEHSSRGEERKSLLWNFPEPSGNPPSCQSPVSQTPGHQERLSG